MPAAPKRPHTPRPYPGTRTRSSMPFARALPSADHDLLGVLRAVHLLDPGRSRRVLLRELATFLDEEINPAGNRLGSLALHEICRGGGPRRLREAGPLARGHPVDAGLGRILGSVFFVGKQDSQGGCQLD